MQESVTSHPLIVQFQPLLEHLDAFTQAVLGSDDVGVSLEEWAALEAAFAWRFRFAEQGSLQLIGDPGSRLLDLAVARLMVHMQWLLKHMLRPLRALADKDPQLQNNKCVKELSSTLELISGALKSCQTPLHRIGKKLRRISGQPLPYSSAEQSGLAERIERVANLLLVWPSSDPGHMQLQTARVTFLLTDAGKEARKCLTYALENIRKISNVETVFEKIGRAEQLCEEAGLTYKIDSETKLKPKSQQACAQVQLWPVQEYIALSLGVLFMKEYLQMNLISKDEEQTNGTSSDIQNTERAQHGEKIKVAESLCALLEELPCIPAELLATVHQLTSLSDNSKTPLCELMRIGLLHHTMSPSRCLTPHWLTWNAAVDTTDRETVEELITDFEMSQDSLPMHCPLLTSLVTSHVVPKGAERNSVFTNLVAETPLGNQQPTTLKLEVLLDLLWRNTAVLSSPNFTHKLNDAHCAYSTYLKLKETLNSVLLDVSSNKSITSLPRENIAEEFDTYIKNLSEGNNIPEMQKLSEALHKLEKVGKNLEKLMNGKETESDVDILIATGETWLLVGCIQIILLSKFGHFDPVEKRTLQLIYTTEEHKNTSELLYARELQAKLTGLSFMEQQQQDVHPFIIASREKLLLLSDHKKELLKNLAYRPSVQPYYCQLTKDASHYSNSLGSAEMVLGLQHRLQEMCRQLTGCIQHPAPTQARTQQLAAAAEELLNEERMWRNSQRIFASRLQKTYNLHFPDMVAPLLSAIQQLCRGTSLLASTIQKLLVRMKMKLAEDIVKLVQFPAMTPSQGVPLGVANLCLDRVFCQQLQNLLHAGENDLPVKQETYRLMKAGLQDLRNISAAAGNMDSTIWSLYVKILACFVKVWNSESGERKRKEKEKDEMFVQKGTTQCAALSDEQLEALGLQELFPSTVEEDFGDLQQEITLDSNPAQCPKPESVEVEELVSVEDMTFVCQLHLELMKMFTHTEWVAPPPACAVKPDFVSPLLQRFQTFRHLLSRAAPGLDSSVDWRLAPSLAVMASLALRAGSGDLSGASDTQLGSPVHGDSVISKQPSDFYHDADVEEARQCLPILIAITKRTKELQQEWPDHPTLCQIMTVVERITAFPITSPVSRFLTGLELLLEKLRDWEENAHSGVSMATHIGHLTQQIISWRRLELQCWKDCLNIAAHKIAAGASHWWFHVFNILEMYDNVEAPGKFTKEKEFVKVLQDFMENSILGDFHTRLDILFSFHCHAIRLQSSKQGKLLSILWNVHQYYNQFSEAISQRIRDLRAPIEKKLREYVKIARWNDINYWSVKKTVEKSRRTLLKHVREFEKVLKQPVSSILTNPHPGPGPGLLEAAGKLNRPQRRQSMRHVEIPPDFYTASARPGQLITLSEPTQKPQSLLYRAQTLFNKSRSLSKEALSEISYPTLIKTVDEVTIGMIETVNHLKDLEIPADTPNQRRKSLAKSHLQLKKKALTDAFHTLQQMGVSFRKGVAVWNDTSAADGLFPFTLPPLDLHIGVQHSTFQMCSVLKSTTKGSRPEGELATVWDGSETYFYRSIARLSILDTYLKNPHKDIGPALIERLRGFGSHLMIYSKTQKEKLAETFNLLRCLRCYISHVATLKKSDIFLPRQSELHRCWGNLNTLLVNIILCTEQFLVFLGACPTENASSFTIEVIGQSALGEMNSAVYADLSWQTVSKKVKNVLVNALKLKSVLNKSWIALPTNPAHTAKSDKKSDMELPQTPKNLITPSQYELIMEGYEKVSGFVEELKSARAMFEKSDGSDSAFNPMTESLRSLELVAQREVGIFKEITNSDSTLKGVKRSGIEIENKELEICVNVLNPDSDQTPMEIEDIVPSSQQYNVQISLSNKQLTENDKKEVVEEFFSEAELLLETTLIAIQKIYKKYTAKKGEETEREEGAKESNVEAIQEEVKSNDEEEDKTEEVQDNHLKEKILENLYSDLSDLQIPKVNEMLSKLIQRLIALLDLEDWEKEATECKGILLTCIPCIDQLSLLYQFFVTQQAAAYRVTCKMMSVVLSVSIDLAQKGFCIPPELMPEDGEEAGDPKGGLGLGEGEGEKDVSDRIESEDQLEDARQPGEEKEDEDKDCKEEEQGIDTSLDFGGKAQDIEKDENEDESGGSEDEDEADKEMGETGEGAEKLDQEVWGSDSDAEEENEEQEEKEDEHGQGEKTGAPELSAKDDKKKGGEDSEEEDGEDGDKKEKQKDINEFEEPEIDEDHVDPYHGKQPPLPEPEPLDLPDDLQLDEEDGKEGNEEGENPFDIDSMKERNIPEEKEAEEETAAPEDNETKEDAKEDSSDEEEGREDGEEKNQGPEKNEKDGDEDGEGNEEGKKGDEKDEEELKQDEKASASDDVPSEAPAQAADMELESSEASKDVVAEKMNEQKDGGKQDTDDLGEEGGDEEQGVGQAQAEEQKSGHRGHMAAPKDKLPSDTTPPEAEEKQEKRQRPGESDSSRSLGDVLEPIRKRLKTIDIKKLNEEEEESTKEGDEENKEQASEEGKKGEMYRHIKDSKESFDTQTLDAATQEQAERQPVPNKEDEAAEEPSPEDELVLEEDDIKMDEDVKKQNPEQVHGKKDKSSNKPKQLDEKEDEEDADMAVDIEGDVVPTQAPSRGTETTFHTQYNLGELEAPQNRHIDLQSVRQELENQLSTWIQPPADAEAAQAWQGFVAVTAGLSRELSEQLRLVLEPTQAARLRGDYRTGRRINMRKVIPYIASQFRKDKIWLRRTKPSKREYQIILAIDDSSSMADNHTKELAFESLALVSRALSLLEAGELAVVSFGDTPKILHQLGDTFTEHSGGRLLQEFSFSQKHTKVGQLVDFCTVLLRDSRQRVSTASECAQLLMIVSDGRGVFSEGDEKVRLAIRHARQNRIFMVFVILDNPDSKNSILDIRAPVFQGGKLLGIKSYLDSFPFPFYLILRDINCLPAVLSDALRQWFELVTNAETL